MEDLQGVLSQRGLTVSTLPDKGRCLFSIRNFSPGEVILNEEPFVSVPSRASVDSRCEWCFSTSNLKRCSACQVVLYCGSTCQKSDWKLHHLECGVLSKVDKARLKSLTPSIRLMVKLYLRRRLQNEKIIPTTATDNYNLVEALVSHISEIDEKQLVLYAQMANLVNLILELPGIGIKEIAENFSKLACNAHTICDSELRPLGTGLYPVISIINHSCLPNAVLVFEGRLAVVRAVQHIPKGTEVSISYIETAGSTMTRQKALKEQYFFSCSCPRCAKLGQCDDIQESAILEGYRCKDAECSGFLIRDSGDKGFICQHCGLVRGKEEIKKIASEAKLLSEKASKLPSSGYNTEAYVTYKMIEELQLKLCHPFSIDLMRTRETLLKMLMELQDWKEALAYCRSTIPVYQRAYPGFHPLLGLQYYTCGKLEWFEFALFFVYFCLLRMDLYVSPFTNNVLKLFSMPTRSQCPNLWTDFVPCNRDYEHNHENHFYYHLRVIHMKLYLLWIKRLHKVNHR
ncbi:histone-lysine N-methyltransferase ASHR1 isoform X1 [Rhododendron vialii]|uniref:histone-lysine N-methyltransferase ASHR1 isoform X1 n=1 Tax=Rhododendron vialii TaxID=182163 RepID=UPI00265F323F|nr:histone-lysine N-methyltransferase ASHR1 isoform X1 [Rhododendron vialii]